MWLVTRYQKFRRYCLLTAKRYNWNNSANASEKKLGDNFKKWVNINRESVIQVTGIVKENKEAPGGVEMLPEKLEVLNLAETPLPLGVIDKIDSEIETRLNARYLDLRKKEIAANFRIRAAVSGAVHEHLRKENF